MRSFAVAEGRDAKALQIEAVLEAASGRPVTGLSILDLGAGSGHIAAHFARNNTVVAADVEHQLTVPASGLRFELLRGSRLPFANDSFDVVVLNQVLTYVPDQELELAEILRVLNPTGMCYVSLPNRLYPIDPHSRLPFLHYLPSGLYAMALRRISGADELVRMHTPSGMRRLFASAGFATREYTVDVLSNPSRFRAGASPRLPPWRWLSRVSPTNIFILRPSSG